jgi:hypothetical protein
MRVAYLGFNYVPCDGLGLGLGLVEWLWLKLAT